MSSERELYEKFARIAERTTELLHEIKTHPGAESTARNAALAYEIRQLCDEQVALTKAIGSKQLIEKAERSAHKSRLVLDKFTSEIEDNEEAIKVFHDVLQSFGRNIHDRDYTIPG